MVQRLGLSEDSCFLPEALEHRCTTMECNKDKNKNTEDLIKERKKITLKQQKITSECVVCVMGWGMAPELKLLVQ